MAVDAHGHVYVADWENHRLQRFTGDGHFLGAWGGSGPGTYGGGNGQFDHPTGVAVAPDGLVYVADTFNFRIQKFLIAP